MVCVTFVKEWHLTFLDAVPQIFEFVIAGSIPLLSNLVWNPEIALIVLAREAVTRISHH